VRSSSARPFSISYSIPLITCRRTLRALFLDTSLPNATNTSFVTQKPPRLCKLSKSKLFARYALTRFRSATYTGPNPQNYLRYQRCPNSFVSPYASSLMWRQRCYPDAIYKIGSGLLTRICSNAKSSRYPGRSGWYLATIQRWKLNVTNCRKIGRRARFVVR
jgi:hypothetical protein